MTSLFVRLCNRYSTLLATGLGVGFLKPAPGTWGALLGLPFAMILMPFPLIHMLAVGFVFFISIYVTDIYLKKTLKIDPSEVVIDEVLGILISLVWLPLTWFYILGPFVVFRLLDIWKPYPISWLDQNAKGAFGVVIDDVVAGLITNILFQYFYFQGYFII